VPGVAIPHPLGDTGLSKDDELKLRLNVVSKALYALQKNIDQQTIFEKELEHHVSVFH
jgi:glycine reductase